MCDSFVATPEATADGRMLFGKNSDREPYEAQALELVRGAEHRPGALTRCTYRDVPQVRRTRSVLIARPYWMWGAEMGVNDLGVAIGNEAVLTRAPYQERDALLGMDLLRLALERSSSAREALDVITGLLEAHGQGGRTGIDVDLRYHNSFLIADAREAWVLETADRAWVAARARGVRSISNALSLRDDWELASEGLAARARDFGLSPGKGRVDFARVFSDPVRTWGTSGRRRGACITGFLSREQGRRPGVLDAMSALRQHGAPDRPERAPQSFFMTVCGHASFTPLRECSQTTGSLVASIDRDSATAFVTATSAACLSLFKPVWVDAGLPEIGTPGARFDPSCLWWRHERLHRAALGDLGGSLAIVAAERERFEREHFELAREPGSPDERLARSEVAFARARALETRWESELVARARPLPGFAYRRYWRRVDARTGLASSSGQPEKFQPGRARKVTERREF